MAVAHWANANEPEAAERFKAAVRYDGHLSADLVKRAGLWDGEVDRETLEAARIEEAELEQMVTRFGKYGQLALGPPAAGQLVSVRDRRWVVVSAEASGLADGAGVSDNGADHHLVTLASIEDDEAGAELRVIWELEPGREIIEETALPEVDADRRDRPERLDAFLDAVRWGAVTSADARALQAPFRSGIQVPQPRLTTGLPALGGVRSG